MVEEKVGTYYPRNGGKPVYMYDLEGNLLKEFETTKECAYYFDKYDYQYINHNLKYCDKIRKDGKWYRISREKKGNVSANNSD